MLFAMKLAEAHDFVSSYQLPLSYSPSAVNTCHTTQYERESVLLFYLFEEEEENKGKMSSFQRQTHHILIPTLTNMEHFQSRTNLLNVCFEFIPHFHE